MEKRDLPHDSQTSFLSLVQHEELQTIHQLLHTVEDSTPHSGTDPVDAVISSLARYPTLVLTYHHLKTKEWGHLSLIDLTPYGFPGHCVIGINTITYNKISQTKDKGSYYIPTPLLEDDKKTLFDPSLLGYVLSTCRSAMDTTQIAPIDGNEMPIAISLSNINANSTFTEFVVEILTNNPHQLMVPESFLQTSAYAVSEGLWSLTDPSVDLLFPFHIPFEPSPGLFHHLFLVTQLLRHDMVLFLHQLSSIYSVWLRHTAPHNTHCNTIKQWLSSADLLPPTYMYAQPSVSLMTSATPTTTNQDYSNSGNSNGEVSTPQSSPHISSGSSGASSVSMTTALRTLQPPPSISKTIERPASLFLCVIGEDSLLTVFRIFNGLK